MCLKNIMDTKAVLDCKTKINKLAVQHNKLTTLVACLLSEIQSLKKMQYASSHEQKNTLENDYAQNYNTHVSRSGGSASTGRNPNKFPNFHELKADDILQQLSMSSDN